MITLNLTINTTVNTVDVQSACDAYTWINGFTYTANNFNATAFLTSASGCDSIVTLNLTITHSTIATDVHTSCDDFTWIDGNTYTTSNNTATHTVPNSAGCDSVITLDLTIGSPTSSTDVQSSCEPIVWIDGNTYETSNNTATHTIPNAAGCDSVITLDFALAPLDVSTSLTDSNVTANLAGASYQWLDCTNAYSAILGATGQGYTPTITGDYAVAITDASCTDTSDCVLITIIGLAEGHPLPELLVYPNSTRSVINIATGEFSQRNNLQLRVLNVLGQEIAQQRVTQPVHTLQSNELGGAGMYLLQLLDGTGRLLATQTLVVE